jgi:hypothetical protein
MKPAAFIGIPLIILSLIGFTLYGLGYGHTKKTLDIGPLFISHDQRETLPLPPLASAIALVSGMALVYASARRK